MKDGADWPPDGPCSGAEGPADGEAAGAVTWLARAAPASAWLAESALFAWPLAPEAGVLPAEPTGVAAPSSEPSPGLEPPGPSPGARDGASTRLSTPSSSAPFTDPRLSPAR
jgi:hypothetical protein